MPVNQLNFKAKVVKFVPQTTPTFYQDVVLPIMETKGWDQQQLADAAGVVKSEVTHWKNQMAIPDDMALTRLAKHREFDVEFWIYQRLRKNFFKGCIRKGINPEKYETAA